MAAGPPHGEKRPSNELSRGKQEGPKADTPDSTEAESVAGNKAEKARKRRAREKVIVHSARPHALSKFSAWNGEMSKGRAQRH